MLMKKLILAIAIGIVSIASYAQTVTNADGTLALRGNVAVLSTYNAFTFKNGVFEKQIGDEVAEKVKAANNALAIQLFTNAAFGVVNRDNEAYNNVVKLLEEYKSEDYIDGFAIQAKGQGADCLFLIDNTVITKEEYIQYFYSCRFISIANNVGYHFTLKSDPIKMGEEDKMHQAAASLTNDCIKYIQQLILDVFPEQYGIAAASGKKLYLMAYQPTGQIMSDDKFYAFRFSTDQILGGNLSIAVMEKLDEASVVGLESGYLAVKTKSTLTSTDGVYFYRNQAEPKLMASSMPFTFFELPVDYTTYEGFVKKRINNALYHALTRHPGTTLIEQEHLSDLKKERELQKTEDFIDGHVVERIAAIGAQYMLHVENLKVDGGQVTFLLNMVSVEENRILRSIEVTTSIDNIEDELYKQICERVLFPCELKLVDKNILEVSTGWTIAEGDKFIIELTKQIVNPLNGEVSYTVVPLCKCTVSKYMGNKCQAVVTEVLDKKEFKQIEQHSPMGTLAVKMDASAIRSNLSDQTEIDKAVEKQAKKEENRQKAANFMNNLLKGAF